MSSYCANYYGSINCHNVVNRFGDRCKLCLALKSGASMSEGMLPEDAYRKPASAIEVPRHHYHHHGGGVPSSNNTASSAAGKHHHRSHEGMSRSIRVDSRYKK